MAKPSTPTPESKALLTIARAKFNAATDAGKLWDSVLAYHQVLGKDPGNYEALTFLANQYILIGTAHTSGMKKKSRRFQTARRYAELAMYTNPNFRKLADTGKPPWEAVQALTADEAQAMLFWATAVQYDFKEGMFLPEKIANVKWLQYCLTILNRISAVAPEFGAGTVEFGKAICYLSLPGFRGGDKELARRHMEAATRDHKDWLFGKWARGKYYNKITRDPEARKADLEWVATRDVTGFKDPFPWRVYFKQDARRILGMDDE